MGVKDELAVAALARALTRTGMYVDAGIDTSAGLDKPQVYAAALLNDPDLAAEGLHFVMVETLERGEQAAQTARYANGGNLRAALATPAPLDEAWAEAEAALPEGWVLTELSRTYRLTKTDPPELTMDAWMAKAHPARDPESEFGLGDTPAAALRALAARLGEKP